MASPSWTVTRDRGFAVASRLPVTAKDVLDLALFESHTKDVNASAGHLILSPQEDSELVALDSVSEGATHQCACF